MSNALTDLVQSIAPSAAVCRALADDIRRAKAAGVDEQIERAITLCRRRCAASGAAGGAIGNPFVAVPAAFVETGWVLRQHALVAGTIGALIEPDALLDEESFRADVMSIVFPTAATQALGEVAQLAGRACTRQLIRSTVKKDVLKAIVRFAAKYLGLKVTQRAILAKAVPLVGGVIGGTWNYVEAGGVGRRAARYFRGADISG